MHPVLQYKTGKTGQRRRMLLQAHMCRCVDVGVYHLPPPVLIIPIGLGIGVPILLGSSIPLRG